jgi:hypothetical protein
VNDNNQHPLFVAPKILVQYGSIEWFIEKHKLFLTEIMRNDLITVLKTVHLQGEYSGISRERNRYHEMGQA